MSLAVEEDGGGSTRSWQEELASLVETTGIQQYPIREADDDGFGLGLGGFVYQTTTTAAKGLGELEQEHFQVADEESFKDQVKGFLKACAEMTQELAKGCKDVLHQSFLSHQHSYLVTKFTAPCAKLRFFNDFLPEDRDPLHAWPVIFLVFTIALAVLCVNTNPQSQQSMPKKVNTHPPSATFVHLPDGRRMAYHERGIEAKRARFSLVSPHSFLSSRLAGIPGIKDSLLEEFGVRLITYDLPGFGESDPHPNRDLNTSARDMLHMAEAVGVSNKFWVVGYSGGGMHAWAALSYIPDRLAGAAMFAPIVNPYDPSMTREERYGIWGKWTRRRKIMFFLALRFPSLLKFFYRRTFLSGEHGQLGKWLSLSLGEKDKALVEEPTFQDFWQRDVEESIRQGNLRPFIEEAILQVSRWGFSLADIQVLKKREKGILPWLKSMYSEAELEWAGFLGPIHIWQYWWYEYIRSSNPILIAGNDQDLIPRIQSWGKSVRLRSYNELTNNAHSHRGQLELKDGNIINWQPWDRSWVFRVAPENMNALDPYLRRMVIAANQSFSLSSCRYITVAAEGVRSWYLGDRCWHQVSGSPRIPHPPPSSMDASDVPLGYILSLRDAVGLGWPNGYDYTMAGDYQRYWARVGRGSLLPDVYRASNFDGVTRRAIRDTANFGITPPTAFTQSCRYPMPDPPTEQSFEDYLHMPPEVLPHDEEPHQPDYTFDPVHSDDYWYYREWSAHGEPVIIPITSQTETAMADISHSVQQLDLDTTRERLVDREALIRSMHLQLYDQSRYYYEQRLAEADEIAQLTARLQSAEAGLASSSTSRQRKKSRRRDDVGTSH